MRITESYLYSPSGTVRAAVPAPAREILKSDPGFETDSTAGVAVSPTAGRKERVAELRRFVQEGRYKVDAEEVSRKIVDSHLER